MIVWWYDQLRSASISLSVYSSLLSIQFFYISFLFDRLDSFIYILSFLFVIYPKMLSLSSFWEFFWILDILFLHHHDIFRIFVFSFLDLSSRIFFDRIIYCLFTGWLLIFPEMNDIFFSWLFLLLFLAERSFGISIQWLYPLV